VNISKSNIRLSGAKAMAAALQESQITELNISENQLTWNDSGSGYSMDGVVALGDGIKNNGALAKLIFGGDEYYDYEEEMDVTPEPAVLEVGMTKADLSNKNLGAGGAIIVGAWISHKDNGALTSLNISNNSIVSAIYIKAPREGIKVGDIIDGNPVIKEKDSDGEIRILQLDGIKALADGIKNNGALEKLLMAKNGLGTKEAGEVLGGVLGKNTVLKELDLSDNYVLKSKGGDPVGFAKGIANGVKNNGALTSLNISDNKIGQLVPESGWQRIDDDEHGDHYFVKEGEESAWEIPTEPAGVIALEGAIKNNRALVKLNMSSNSMASKEAGEALGDMLKANSVLKELDVSNNFAGCGQTDGGVQLAKGMADGLSANGALTSLDLRHNNLPKNAQAALQRACQGKTLSLVL